MEKSKYEKFVDDNGNYSYDITLSDGTKFEGVQKELGDYVFSLEKKLNKQSKSE